MQFGNFREVKEESGVSVSNLRKVGNLEFTFEGENFLMDVHIYEANGFTGQPIESDGTSVCLKSVYKIFLNCNAL